MVSRRVAQLLTADADRHRYLRGIRSLGFQQVGLEIERDERSAERQSIRSKTI